MECSPARRTGGASRDEAAGIALRSKRCPQNLHRWHDRLTCGDRANKHQAKVAVARELCELVYVHLEERRTLS
jgi:hypothetical protein